jgi:hypothetical protein
MTKITKGSCNCGGVTWEVQGEMRPIVACHCSQCRKQSGLYFAATAADDKNLTIKSDALKWYKASPEARRGFCGTCGSSLFWKHDDEDFTSILAGSIDGVSGLEIAKHIYVGDKPDWYDITDGKPQS